MNHQQQQQVPLVPGMVVGNYSIGRRIGSGTHSVVFAAKKRTSHLRENLALKFVKNSEGSVNPLAVNEIRILKVLRNQPNIVHFFKEFEWSTYTVLVLDLNNHLDLEEMMRYVPDNRLQPKVLIKVALDAIDILEYVHSKQILHRSVKAPNFVFSNVSSDTGSLKIIDFGCAVEFHWSRQHADQMKPVVEDNLAILARSYSTPSAKQTSTYTMKDDVVMLCYMCLKLAGAQRSWYAPEPWVCTRFKRALALHPESRLDPEFRFLLPFVRSVHACHQLKSPEYEVLKTEARKCVANLDPLPAVFHFKKTNGVHHL